MTKEPGAIHTFGGWSHEGDQIAFSANREDAARFDVYVQKIGQAGARLVAKGPGRDGRVPCVLWEGRRRDQNGGGRVTVRLGEVGAHGGT